MSERVTCSVCGKKFTVHGDTGSFLMASVDKLCPNAENHPITKKKVEERKIEQKRRVCFDLSEFKEIISCWYNAPIEERVVIKEKDTKLMISDGITGELLLEGEIINKSE